MRIEVVSAVVIPLLIAVGIFYTNRDLDYFRSLPVLPSNTPANRARQNADKRVPPNRPRRNRENSTDSLLGKIAGAQDSALSFLLEHDLPHYLAQDPAAVAQALDQSGAGPDRELILRRVSRLWAGQEPAQALRWAASLADQHERELLISEVCVVWAETDPRKALEVAASQSGDNRSETIRTIVYNWTSRDLGSASFWVLAQTSDELRSQLVQLVAIKRAESHPKEAAQLVLDQIPAGDRRNEAIISVLHQWALRDPQSAKAWVALFPPESSIKERAVRELVNLEAFR